MSRFAFVLAFLLTDQSMVACRAQSCAVADPTSELVKVIGDSEFDVDPDDPRHDVIYISNVQDGKSQIVAAHIDGKTATVIPGSLTTIADNFRGLTSANGPEFVYPPSGRLGVLYRADDGVHGVFRQPSPKAWNDFHFDVYGARVGKNPPTLKSTYRQSYEGGGLPFHQNTYTLFAGPCSDRCFANMRSGIPTDVASILSKIGLTVQPNYLTQSVEDGTILMKACVTPITGNQGFGSDGSASLATASQATTDKAANGKAINNEATVKQWGPVGSCGIYEARIDDGGGLKRNSLRSLVTLPPDVVPLVERHPMAVARDPVTGTTVLFIPGSHETGQTVDVYEQAGAHRPFTLVGSAAVTSSDHYRIISDGRILLLHYIIFDGNGKGSYSVSVSAEHGRLEVGPSKLISSAAVGAEVDYLPAARSFVIFFVSQNPANQLQRCFFEP